MIIDLARQRIDELRHLNAFISVTDQEGLSDVDRDAPVVAVKDLVDVRGMVTTGGGTFLPRDPATQDAAVIARLRDGGALFIGKTNLAEFAIGVTSENPHYGDVRNFRDPKRVAGGSSGGSAVAVAAGMCDWAIGTDTGGSIRIPSALNGVVGFKPTHALIPTDGVIPLSRTLDNVGPMAPDVDAMRRAFALMLGQGYTNAPPPTSLDGFRLGIPAGWVADLDEPTAIAWSHVSRGLPHVRFPDRADMAAQQVTILQSEATAVHLDWMTRFPDQYSPLVLEKLIAGKQVTAVEYLHARSRQETLTVSAASAMGDVDALVLPTCPTVAPYIGGPDPVATLTRYTKPFSLTGQPAVTIPFPTDGLPIGIQVVGRVGEDWKVLEIARALEEAWKNHD